MQTIIIVLVYLDFVLCFYNVLFVTWSNFDNVFMILFTEVFIAIITILIVLQEA
jgi:hypothetical protein